jgi:uncharacterized membrane protein YkvA (DUF1232 family)
VSLAERDWLNRIRDWAARLRSELIALGFCARHPRTPFLAKALAVLVVAYAFSPIDLIPDFIPVLGYLDDLLLVPAGLWLTIRLVPREVMEECRAQAASWLQEGRERPRNRAATALVIALIAAAWLVVLWLGWRWAGGWLSD